LIVIIPSVIVLTCIAYTIRAQRGGIFEGARMMLVHIAMPKAAPPPDHDDDELGAIDISPPDDPILREMVDMAPHHAKKCADLQEPACSVVLALSEQAMYWPSGTEKKQVQTQKRLQAMLHHDRMSGRKHNKYLEHGPRQAAAAGS